MIDIQIELQEMTEYNRQNPEAQEFRVLTDDRPTAMAVARLMAQQLRPDRVWGDVLWLEEDGTAAFLAAVHDCGPVPRGAKGA